MLPPSAQKILNAALNLKIFFLSLTITHSMTILFNLLNFFCLPIYRTLKIIQEIFALESLHIYVKTSAISPSFEYGCETYHTLTLANDSCSYHSPAQGLFFRYGHNIYQRNGTEP